MIRHATLLGLLLAAGLNTTPMLTAVADSDCDSKRQLLEEKIAKYPQALWLGEWNSNVYRKVRYVVDLAAEKNELPIFIAYNVPGRDCGQHSQGGLADKEAYQRWIRQIAAGICDRGAVVVLEPDAAPSWENGAL